MDQWKGDRWKNSVEFQKRHHFRHSTWWLVMTNEADNVYFSANIITTHCTSNKQEIWKESEGVHSQSARRFWSKARKLITSEQFQKKVKLQRWKKFFMCCAFLKIYVK